MSKAAEAPRPMKMKPSMYLEDGEARSLHGLPIGSRISTTATGRLASMSMDRSEGGMTRHSARIEFDRVKHSPAAKKSARRQKIAAIRSGGKS